MSGKGPPGASKGIKRQKSVKGEVSGPRTAVADDTLLLNAVRSYFKKAAVVLAVWTFGYYRYSPSWLLLGLVVYVWKEKHNAAKKNTIAIAQGIARDEKGVILARVDDLPSWVSFPDVERCQWVNKMIDQLWPFIGDYVRQLLQEQIEPQIRASLPPSLGSFKFSKIDLGDIPPRIGGVKVYTSEVKRNEIYMDMEINYASDCNFTVNVKGMNFGIRDFTLRGTLRIIFRPLINKVPLIGGMSIFFLNNPEVDFNLTSLANAFDLPGLSDMLHSIITEQIAAIMVLPNRIPIKMASDVDLRKLQYPEPQGVLRLQVIEAKDLIKTDISITGKGKSDPYTICTVGAQTFQTKVIDNTVDPVWDEIFEFIIDERDGQMLELQLKDKDPGNKDDPLGNTTMDIGNIHDSGTLDEWLPLSDVKKGMVHIRATWLYLATDPLELDRVKAEKVDEESIHSALLLVNLDSAMDLPQVDDKKYVVNMFCCRIILIGGSSYQRGKKTLMEPSPFAILSVGQTTKESQVRAATTEPRWEQNFRFFVANPNHQNLEMEIRDGKTKKSIGNLIVRLKDVLNAEDMVMDKKFHLRGAETSSSVQMSLILRVLTPDYNEEWDATSRTSKDIAEDSPTEVTKKSAEANRNASLPPPKSPPAKRPLSAPKAQSPRALPAPARSNPPVAPPASSVDQGARRGQGEYGSYIDNNPETDSLYNAITGTYYVDDEDPD